LIRNEMAEKRRDRTADNFPCKEPEIRRSHPFLGRKHTARHLRVDGFREDIFAGHAEDESGNGQLRGIAIYQIR